MDPELFEVDNDWHLVTPLFFNARVVWKYTVQHPWQVSNHCFKSWSGVSLLHPPALMQAQVPLGLAGPAFNCIS